VATSPTLLPPTKRTPFVYPNGHLMETSLQFLQKMFDAFSLWVHPSDSIDPANNGDLVVEATDNTTLTFKFKGSDGTVRSGTVTLS
jgi:hypothetical protein